MIAVLIFIVTYLLSHWARGGTVAKDNAIDIIVGLVSTLIVGACVFLFQLFVVIPQSDNAVFQRLKVEHDDLVSTDNALKTNFAALTDSHTHLQQANKILEARVEEEVAKNEARTQRAVVTFQKIPGVSHINPSTRQVWWSFAPVWFNSGNTLTPDAACYDNCSIRDAPLPDDFNFGPPTGTVLPTVPIAAKDSVSGVEIQIGGDVLAQVLAGSKLLYIWGEVRYHDVFPGTPQHITKFGVQIIIRGDPTKIVGADNIVEFIPQYLSKNNTVGDLP